MMATKVRVVLYIDGFNLYYGLHSMFGRRYLWLDPWALAHALLRTGRQALPATDQDRDG
jgi:hypothetical protein